MSETAKCRMGQRLNTLSSACKIVRADSLSNGSWFLGLLLQPIWSVHHLDRVLIRCSVGASLPVKSHTDINTSPAKQNAKLKRQWTATQMTDDSGSL
eukprot:359580-Rhodomonas_salina.3